MITKELENTIIEHLKPFKPKTISLFGSYVRTDNTSKSDLDILVDFYETHIFYKHKHNINKISNMWVPSYL